MVLTDIALARFASLTSRKATALRVLQPVGNDIMGKDFHKNAFDDGTRLKLSLFENYLKDWLPVFLRGSDYYQRINIFDFFSGPGHDPDGNPGSPLIMVQSLHPYFSAIIEKELIVTLFLNERSKKKLNALKSLISRNNYDKKPITFSYSCLEFEEAFKESLPYMKASKSANFVFLDQCGVKQVTKDVFLTLVALKATDFLFFISSSTINRFYDHPEIRKYIKISKATISDSKYLHIHRVVHDYYKEFVPKDTEYYLASFSIKKGANIYGLIFGTRHLLGIDKFLSKCWRIDPDRGEANFDIDQDGPLNSDQMVIFPEFSKPQKLKLFEEDLAHRLLTQRLRTNKDIYKYTLESGFLAKHSRTIIGQLIADELLPKQKLNISYNSCKCGAPEQLVRLRANG